MPRRFVKRPDTHKAIIPGVGLVKEGQVLEGDQWAKFVPSVLTEILDSTPTGPTPQLLVDAPAFEPAPERSWSDAIDTQEQAPLLTETAPAPKRRRYRS